MRANRLLRCLFCVLKETSSHDDSQDGSNNNDEHQDQNSLEGIPLDGNQAEVSAINHLSSHDGHSAMSAQGGHTVTDYLSSQGELTTTSELTTQEEHAASGEQEGEDLGKLDYSLYRFCPIIVTDTATDALGSQEELTTTSELTTQEGHAASGEQEGEDLGKLDYNLYSFCPIIVTDTATDDLNSQEELCTTRELSTQEGHAAAGELGSQEGGLGKLGYGFRPIIGTDF